MYSVRKPDQSSSGPVIREIVTKQKYPCNNSHREVLSLPLYRDGSFFIYCASLDKLFKIMGHYVTEHFHFIMVYILLHTPTYILPHIYVLFYVHPPCLFVHP